MVGHPFVVAGCGAKHAQPTKVAAKALIRSTLNEPFLQDTALVISFYKAVN
jgi:hypothetical protein